MPAPIIPPDAMEKIEAKAKGTDFYEGLSDEEREAEGLPPRETEKPAETPTPGETPPEPPQPEEAEPETDEDEAEGEDQVEALFNELASLRQDLKELKKREVEEPKDDELDPALVSDDPAVSGPARRTQELEKRIASLEAAARETHIRAQAAQDDADFKAVQDSYLVDGKPMTDEQVDRIGNYILKNEEAGSVLTIEEVARRVFKARMTPKPKSAPAKGSAGKAVETVATVVTEGSAGGPPAGPWKPQRNTTIEQAVHAYAKTAGWKR